VNSENWEANFLSADHKPKNIWDWDAISLERIQRILWETKKRIQISQPIGARFHNWPSVQNVRRKMSYSWLLQYPERNKEDRMKLKIGNNEWTAETIPRWITFVRHSKLVLILLELIPLDKWKNSSDVITLEQRKIADSRISTRMSRSGKLWRHRTNRKLITGKQRSQTDEKFSISSDPEGLHLGDSRSENPHIPAVPS